MTFDLRRESRQVRERRKKSTNRVCFCAYSFFCDGFVVSIRNISAKIIFTISFGYDIIIIAKQIQLILLYKWQMLTVHIENIIEA